MDFVAREHENVREHLGHMVAIAADPSDIPVKLRNRLDAVFGFLHADLLTLMTFEEETLYPALDRIPGVPHTPGAMAADHDRIKRAIDLLDDSAGAHGWERWSGALHRPLVVDVHARIRAHLDTEEFLYGPLLSHSTHMNTPGCIGTSPQSTRPDRRVGGLRRARDASTT